MIAAWIQERRNEAELLRLPVWVPVLVIGFVELLILGLVLLLVGAIVVGAAS